MANSKVHRQVGKVSGVVAAVARARNGDSALDVLTFGLGGYIGGALGARLPDIIEPAVHSQLRHVAHSLATATAIAASAIESIERVESYAQMRAQAAADAPCAAGRYRVAEHRQSPQGTPREASARVVAGLGAGYLSHLALDAGTPRGIPLLMRGF
jgi:hypothetical protein